MKRYAKIALGLSVPAILAVSGVPAFSQSNEADGDEATLAEPEAPYVRPDVQAYLDQVNSGPQMVFTKELLARIRSMPAANALSSLDLPVGELGEVRDLKMPGPDSEIALRLFDVRETREPGPVVVFYHGGGFVVGSIDTHAGLAAEMSRALDLPVISVEYRLAPENPFPAAPEDAVAAARWIAENGEAFSREFTSLILSGDSAGGNLTLVASAALAMDPAKLPVVMQLPIYPATDATLRHPSRDVFGDGYGLSSTNIALYEQHYAPVKDDWRRSPVLSDLTIMPPTVLVTASLDPLRDEGRAFASKLIESGVPTSFYEAKGNVHGFATYRRAIPSSVEDVEAFLGQARSMLEEVVGAN